MNTFDAAYREATQLASDVNSLRLQRIDEHGHHEAAERGLAAETARLTLTAAAAGTNDLARRAALAEMQAADEGYRAARLRLDQCSDRLATIDADLSAGHDRLGLLKLLLQWHIAERQADARQEKAS